MKLMKLLCLLLALVAVLPIFASCKNEEPKPAGDTDPSGDTTIIADVPKRNYNTVFTIKDQQNLYYWSEDYEASASIDIANYERELAIEEHLGIEIYHESFANIDEIAGDIQQMILAGLDEYQLALTHCYAGLGPLMMQKHLMDLSEVPGISLNEEYYNNSIMESVKFQGHMYLGSSSFIIHRPNYIVFNKSMADAYTGIGTATLYEHVRNQTWTMEQMQNYAKMVDISLNDTLTDPRDGTYGMALHKDWELCSFVTASGYFHGWVDSDGALQLRGFSEDLFDIFKEVVEMTDANYSWTWGYQQDDKKLLPSSGRVLFSIVSQDVMINEMFNSEVKLGVLPVPTMEEGMTTQNLDWAGYFVVPASVKDQQMSGEVIELLSYYGETKIKHEFYDVLLGLRASEAPEDQEMLDLIFDNLAVDPIIPVVNLGDPVAEIFYCVPWMISKGDKALRSWYQKWHGSACELLKEVNK